MLFPEWLGVTLSLVLGACLGSFITLVSHRMPLDEEMVVTPSRCPACRKRLGVFDLFPIFSWVFAGGKCRHCKTGVSVRYPLIELVSALVTLFIYMQFGFTFAGLFLVLMMLCMLIMIVIDFEHGILPDKMQAMLLVFSAAFMLTRDGANEETFMQMIAGAGVGAFTGLALRYGFYAWKKKEGLGWGDVKYLPIAGMLVGTKPFVLLLFFSGVLGVLTSALWTRLKRGAEFPFGPALIVSTFALVYFREALSHIEWLREFYR